jgi:hypothetical protein
MVNYVTQFINEYIKKGKKVGQSLAAHQEFHEKAGREYQ